MSKVRKLTEKRIVVATHNPGKLREINELLAPHGLEAVSAEQFGLPEPVEDGLTFAANARIKAHAAAKGSGLPALADDSGLAVDALGGAPGIYSARWGGEDKDFNMAMMKVEEELLKGGAFAPEDRGARFVCALCLAWPDGHDEVFEGKVTGYLVWPPRGNNGFGYDPIFISEGNDITFGQMDPQDKHEISHRADAFRQLTSACF